MEPKTSSHTVRDKIFKDHKFYQSEKNSKVSARKYQRNQHQKQEKHHSYQHKKKPIFTEYQFSSSWNPLHKKYARVDPPYKDLYERKQAVKNYSHRKTDPFCIKPKISSKCQNKISDPLNHYAQYRPSINYLIEHERKYLLPKDRQISKPNRHYYTQLGISQQRIVPPSSNCRKQNMKRNNSLLMKLSLDYTIDKYDKLNKSIQG